MSRNEKRSIIGRLRLPTEWLASASSETIGLSRLYDMKHSRKVINAPLNFVPRFECGCMYVRPLAAIQKRAAVRLIRWACASQVAWRRACVYVIRGLVSESRRPKIHSHGDRALATAWEVDITHLRSFTCASGSVVPYSRLFAPS